MLQEEKMKNLIEFLIRLIFRINVKVEISKGGRKK